MVGCEAGTLRDLGQSSGTSGACRAHKAALIVSCALPVSCNWEPAGIRSFKVYTPNLQGVLRSFRTFHVSQEPSL